MKRTYINILIGLILLAGFGFLVYPTVSDQWNTYQQNKQISSYQNTVASMEEEDFTDEWESAGEFNDTLLENRIYDDVFGLEDSALENTEYWKVLNTAGDGIMGYLSIPKINVELSIYHGTAENVLQTGVGHLNGTKLPVGGEGNHSVLVAHRGLPSARLFTDVDQLETGDMFYVHVLDETLAYQVDQIQDMIEADDYDTLAAALTIEEGEDQVTLFTCTPYGVNSHRLLIRGTRTDYLGEDEAVASIPEAFAESVQDYYMFYLLFGLVAAGIALLVMKLVQRRRHVEQIPVQKTEQKEPAVNAAETVEPADGCAEKEEPEPADAGNGDEEKRRREKTKRKSKNRKRRKRKERKKGRG